MQARKIPKHLQKYTVKQEYHNYTAINHAVWRYVMRQNHHTLKDFAHEAYTDGLKASGITIDRLPDVEEMNQCLAPFGWGAATIDGFIPGVAFFEFQANGILPVVAEIRKLENIQYTPAPDIIHEAAGHAPILCDEKYSEYVKLFGEIGKKAIATKEEHDLFEAVRSYSNLLEKGSATDEKISEAKRKIDEVAATIKGISEAERISRLYWWTVEYGLIGELDHPKIYGAGLLSSVSEGRNALSAEVEKIQYDLQTMINTGFDITKPQPQLFVCDSFEQLIEGVKEFAMEMAFMKGGTESLEKARQSANVATVEYSSGLQVTGVINELLYNDNNEAVYIKMSGPTALAYQSCELPGHGTETHQEGFGAPIGRLKDVESPLECLTEEELANLGIVINRDCLLTFESGVEVKGTVQSMVKQDQKIQIISFTDCLVTYQGQILFAPDWGIYDMAVGECIPSVYAGAADGEAYYTVEVGSQTATEHSIVSSPLEDLYQQIRDVREKKPENSVSVIESVWRKLGSGYKNDWLLRLEVVELLKENNWLPSLQEEVHRDLKRLQKESDELEVLISRGVQII
ncbi:aromatic amino acid hydroxylase [Anaerobacillus sp. CMMVII]|uniref:aromatic amino acid hydroxylase n=1 Tax=Anaerobacillus sp. CMMVII TaxID=2755588 RepID=UPI0021B71271|nr:aromatic amino acid hydroxylase [Anaerobacillus sp. CMMVII]